MSIGTTSDSRCDTLWGKYLKIMAAPMWLQNGGSPEDFLKGGPILNLGLQAKKVGVQEGVQLWAKC